MEPTSKQEALAAIKEAKKILIISHQNPDGDVIGSLLALGAVLKKIGKDISIASSGKVPNEFRFLKDWEAVHDELDGVKDFVLSVTEDHAKVDRLSYKLEDGKLNIVISPKEGNFVPRDVSFSYGDYHFDLLIVLDCGNLEMLGDLYLSNAEMFFKNKTLNIDHHKTNAYFANINWVNDSASSTCEILVSLIEALESERGKLMDKDIATALLLGIMTDTNLFQNPNTTSKSLTVTAQLIAAEGDRELISEKVFRTRSYATLKIWGKILSRLNSYPSLGIIWSEVSNQDINETGATNEALLGAINDLLGAAEGAKIALLFKERNGVIEIDIRTTKEYSASEIAKNFSGGGHPKAAGFKMNGSSLEGAKKVVLEYLRNLVQPNSNLNLESKNQKAQLKTQNQNNEDSKNSNNDQI